MKLPLLKILNEGMTTDEWREHHNKLAHGPDGDDDWTYEEYMEWFTIPDLFKAIDQVNRKLVDAGKDKDIQLDRLSLAYGDKKAQGVRPGIIKRLKHLGYEIPQSKKDHIKDIASD